MELKVERNSDVDSWKEVVLIYNSALKQISTKLEILNDEFQHVHMYNPIEHIKSRMKTSESIVKKLKKYGYESTIENMVKYINDMEIHEIVKAIKKIMEYKLDVNDYLDILTVWYRDVLLFKATKDMNSLVFKNEIQQIRRVADRSTYEGIETIVSALQQAKRRLEANVNFDLTMELLLLAIQEN